MTHKEFFARLKRERAMPPPEVGELWVYTQEGTTQEHPFLVIETTDSYIKLWNIIKNYIHTDYAINMRIDTRWRHEG